MIRTLHVLDHSIPLHSGYTFRTAGLLRDQPALNMKPRRLTSPKQNRTTTQFQVLSRNILEELLLEPKSPNKAARQL